jgi:hypothetical protein
LGAGASREAKTPAGVACPTTKQLINHLSKSFLGGKYTDLPLNQVAEYAISESDLQTVQTSVRAQFLDLQPTAAHQKLPLFERH